MLRQENKSVIYIRACGLSAALACFMAAPLDFTCLAQDAAVPAASASVVNAASIPGAMGSISRNAATGNMLHVTLGHALYIDTKTRLRRVYISDPGVINSVTLNPNQLLITGMTPGISSLTLMDEAGLAQSYVVSSDIDIDGLRSAMSAATRSDAVKIEGMGSRVTLSGTVTSQAMADTAVKLAGLYAKDVANAMVVDAGHPKQVRLQVRILEVDRSKLLQLGVNLFSPTGYNTTGTSTSAQFPSAVTGGQGGAAGAAATAISVTNPLNFFLYNFKYNIGATIEDLQTKQVLQILAEPTITTISGEKADFLSGGEFPFPIVSPGGGAGSAPVVSVSFRPFGVKVEFTPIVNEDGTIRLKVMPEVSALDYSNAVTVSGTTVPALSTRRASTEVELRSNQSFAISGLLDQRTTDAMSKNPGAASIPILGALFKSKSVNHSTTELVVVVTPTVVDPLAETTPPSQPDLPIPTLDTGGFDKSLGKNLNPHPAAPPINPNQAPFGSNVVPQPPDVNNTGVAPAAGSAGPVSAPPGLQSPQIRPATTSGAPREPASTGDSAPMPMPANGNVSAKSSVRPPAAMVEVMTLSHESDAEAMVAALKRRGYEVAISHAPNDPSLHLDVGPFASNHEAEAMRQRLLMDGYNATMK